MKIGCYCPTANHAHLLGRLIKCFTDQTYPAADRFLLIVDDVQQLDNQSGPGWEIVSLPRRVLTLGEKNNLVVSMMPPDVDYLCKADSDDIYAPWWLEAMAEAFTRGEWVQPRMAIDCYHGRWQITETWHKRDPHHFCYHGSWGFSRKLFARHGGYRPTYAGDDGEFQKRLLDAGHHSVDINLAKFKPFYFYNRRGAGAGGQISQMGGGREAYEEVAKTVQYVGKVPEWASADVPEIPSPADWIERPW